MKIDYARLNVLGTPLRVLDEDAEALINQLVTEIQEFYEWHWKHHGTEPTIVQVTHVARTIITSQIRRGLWELWEIHEPEQMGHLNPTGPAIAWRLMAFEPRERNLE